MQRPLEPASMRKSMQRRWPARSSSPLSSKIVGATGNTPAKRGAAAMVRSSEPKSTWVVSATVQGRAAAGPATLTGIIGYHGAGSLRQGPRHDLHRSVVQRARDGLHPEAVLSADARHVA